MRDGPDKGTLILQQKHMRKEHSKAGLPVGKVLHFPLMQIHVWDALQGCASC